MKQWGDESKGPIGRRQSSKWFQDKSKDDESHKSEPGQDQLNPFQYQPQNKKGFSMGHWFASCFGLPMITFDMFPWFAEDANEAKGSKSAAAKN